MTPPAASIAAPNSRDWPLVIRPVSLRVGIGAAFPSSPRTGSEWLSGRAGGGRSETVCGCPLCVLTGALDAGRRSDNGQEGEGGPGSCAGCWWLGSDGATLAAGGSVVMELLWLLVAR